MEGRGASVAQPVEEASRGTRGLAWGALLVLLAAVVYANAAFHPFVYDDLPLVLKNPAIRSLSNLDEIVGFTSEGFQPKTRWTRTASHALEFAVVGAWAPLYHMTNIALHALVGLIVFAFVGRIAANRALGFWAAAFFVVHPLNTEVVAHVSGRRDLLAALFSLVALMLLERFTRSGGVWRLACAVVAIYFAVFSKEVAVMTPFAFMALDTWAASRRALAAGAGSFWGEHLRSRAKLYTLLAAVALCLGGVVLFLSPDVTLAGSPSIYDTHAGGLGLVERLSLSGLGVRLLLVPVGQTIDYSFDALDFASGLGSRAMGDLAILAAAAGLACWGLWRRSIVGFAGLWYVLFYLPHVGLVPWHEIFAERFLYIPSIAVGIALAALATRLAATRPRVLTAAGAVVLCVLGGLTLARNQAWGSSLALWESAVERYPRCARAHKALADAQLAETRPDFALEHYRAAVEIWPTYLDAHTGVAIAYVARREYSMALEKLDEILRRWPGDAKALNAKAYVHETMGDLQAAMDAYQQAIDSDPTLADGYNNLGRLYVQKGEIDTAIRMYEQALERNPAMVRTLENLALVYREGLQDEEKAAHYEAEARRLQGLR